MTFTDPMQRAILFLLLWATGFNAIAQDDEPDLGWRIGVGGGVMNYQGDLQPSIFYFGRTRAMASLWVRKPLSAKSSIRGGFIRGSFTGDDKYNRPELQVRNLSFASSLTEVHLAFDYTLFDLASHDFSPYGYLGLVGFRFNPYAYDRNGVKRYLQPLSTEGQGLAQYPDRKPYSLTQFAIGYAGGVRMRLSDRLLLHAEAGQRKTFTDHLDDVSSSYVDPSILTAARGPIAADLAYRTDELRNDGSFPNAGDQRGTPTEMDWYYFLNVGMELRLDGISNLRLFRGRGKGGRKNGCPRNVL